MRGKAVAPCGKKPTTESHDREWYLISKLVTNHLPESDYIVLPSRELSKELTYLMRIKKLDNFPKALYTVPLSL